MIVLAIVIAAVVLFALLRFGVCVEYCEDGFIVTALVGPLSIRAYPRKEKPKRAERKAARKARKEKKPRRKKEKKRAEKKPGGLQGFLDIVSVAKTALNRLRRKLLIKRLTVHFVAASADPSKTAMIFGGANAAFSLVVPLLENCFRIRRRDLRTAADFDAIKPGIYVNAAVSIAVWETVYVAFAILPLFTRGLQGNSKKK